MGPALYSAAGPSLLSLSSCRVHIRCYIFDSVMKDRSKRQQAKIEWEGDSKEVLSSFPHDVKATLGFSLRQIQNGNGPRCSHRPMTSVGKGVWELKDGDERTWYRLMYLTRIGDTIHVLHCFEKDSRRTDRRDLEVAKARLKEIRQRLLNTK